MKKILLTVSGIIATVIGIILCFTIIGIIIGVPLIIGGSKMIKYSNLPDSEIEANKNSILAWSIFFLLFTFAGGVLGLIFYFSIDTDFFVAKKMSYIDELKELDKLRKQGLISDKEYEAKKKKILDI